MNGKTLDLVRFCVRGGEAPVIENWNEVIADMRVHAILPIIGLRDSLKTLQMPAETKAFFQKLLFRQMATYAMMLNAQSSLTQLLESRGMKAVILKGFSACVYYPVPMFRTLGDIDFMVRGGTPEQAKDILEQNGYTGESSQAQLGRPEDVRHYGLHKDSISFELHSSFTRGETAADMTLEKILLDADTTEDSLANEPFCRFTDPVNGLVLLSHMRHHLQSSGIGLRQLLDWMFFAERFLTDEAWSTQFLPLARKTKLEHLAVYATAVCEKYLGLGKHGFTVNAEPALTDALFREIMESGNFGRNRVAEVSQVSEFLSSPNVFKRLQYGGQASWEAYKKHPRLRPFAWIYQSFHLAGKVLKNRKLVSSMKAGKELASEKEALLNRLQIYRSNNNDPEE